jgi:hypothetical protein
MTKEAGRDYRSFFFVLVCLLFSLLIPFSFLTLSLIFNRSVYSSTLARNLNPGHTFGLVNMRSLIVLLPTSQGSLLVVVKPCLHESNRSQPGLPGSNCSLACRVQLASWPGHSYFFPLTFGQVTGITFVT